ncbi:unnamed protein product [Malus baccata var. baccata]
MGTKRELLWRLRSRASRSGRGCVDAVVEALVEGVKKLVVEVNLGFEGQEGDNVRGWEKEIWRRQWEWKGSPGVDGGGDEEEVWRCILTITVH